MKSESDEQSAWLKVPGTKIKETQRLKSKTMEYEASLRQQNLSQNRDTNFLLQIHPPIHAVINLVHFPIRLFNLPNIAQKLPGRAHSFLTVTSLCAF